MDGNVDAVTILQHKEDELVFLNSTFSFLWRRIYLCTAHSWWVGRDPRIAKWDRFFSVPCTSFSSRKTSLRFLEYYTYAHINVYK